MLHFACVETLKRRSEQRHSGERQREGAVAGAGGGHYRRGAALAVAGEATAALGAAADAAVHLASRASSRGL